LKLKVIITGYFQGDSGGGLMTQNANGNWVLLGVTSYGSDCEQLLNMSVKPRAQTFTNVRLYSFIIDRFTGMSTPKRQI
uniref:Peptidase S1 domain-containing protein n=1 Tax=Gongylonema pulchrum TaxID=637853 RepID=A0A183DHP4_9BILA